MSIISNGYCSHIFPTTRLHKMAIIGFWLVQHENEELSPKKSQHQLSCLCYSVCVCIKKKKRFLLVYLSQIQPKTTKGN